MGKIKTTLSYWLLIVVPEAFRTAWNNSKIKVAVIGLLSTAIILGFLFILHIGEILPVELETLLRDFEGETRVQGVVTVVTLIVFIVLFFYGLVYTPAKIHQEQDHEIAQLKNLLIKSSPNLEIHIIPVDADEIASSDSEIYASIELINHEKKDIENCYAVFDSIKRYKDDETEGSELWEEIREGEFLPITWSRGSDHSFYKTIKRNSGTAKLNLVMPYDEELYFLLQGKTSKIKLEGRYKMKGHIEGEFDNRNIKAIPFSCELYARIIEGLREQTQNDSKRSTSYRKMVFDFYEIASKD